MTSNPKSIYLEYLQEIKRKIEANIHITKKEEKKLSDLFINNVVYDTKSCIQEIILDAKVKVQESPPENVFFQRVVLNDIIDNIELHFSLLANNQSKNPAYDTAKLFELAFDAGALGLGFSLADRVYNEPFRLKGREGGVIRGKKQTDEQIKNQNKARPTIISIWSKNKSITIDELAEKAKQESASRGPHRGEDFFKKLIIKMRKEGEIPKTRKSARAKIR